MERTLVIRNPACSHAEKVQHDVLNVLHDELPPANLTELWTPSANRAETIEAIAAVIQPGDRIIVAAGDGTGNAVANAYISAKAEGSRIAFLPYGNFNDMASTFTSKAARKNPLLLLHSSAETVQVRPLSVSKNGEQFSYAMLYATVGWTALAAAMFDTSVTRQALQSGQATLTNSLRDIARMYFKTRSSAFLPPFYRDGDENLHEHTTDIVSINGPVMARIIKSQERFYAQQQFLRTDLDVSRLSRNVPFLGKSALNFVLGSNFKLPGARIVEDSLRFSSAELPVQLDGEFTLLPDVANLRLSKDQRVSAPTISIIKTKNKESSLPRFGLVIGKKHIAHPLTL
ncbi:MAG: diacylglycerol kinase family protein [Patescibacteria group bacterium]|nr:diacylglycerol kinase family protein [Patescibacteria group bacterium]